MVGFHAFPSWLRGGFAGVDIFFVISGFLISSIIFESLRKDSFSFREFYARRIRRIFPALILIFIACYIVGWFTLFADEYKQLGKHIAAGAGFISNFIFWKEAGYFDNVADTKPLLHLWSLGVEEQFYIIWPLLLWIAWKMRVNFLSGCITIAALSFLTNIAMVHGNAAATFYSPVTRFWELLTGTFLAYAGAFPSNRISNLNERINSLLSKLLGSAGYGNDFMVLREFQAAVGIVLIGITLLFLNKESAFPGWWALLPTAGAYLILSAGPSAWFNCKVLSNKVLVWFGLISFPLYLWHWPLLSFASILEGHSPATIVRIAAIVISVMLAWLTYKLIETPFRFGAYGKIKVGVLCVLMVGMGFNGLNTYLRNGLAYRPAAKVTNLNIFTMPYRRSCLALTGSEYGDDWCNEGNSSTESPSVLVIGDSFSNSYSTMVSAFIAQNPTAKIKFKQFGRGQCPTLLDYGPPYCRDLTNSIVNYVRKEDTIKTIILASAWPAYFNGKDWGNFKENPDNFRSSFNKTVRFYREMGRKVVILLAPPGGANPRSCITRFNRLSNTGVCDLDLIKAKKNDGDYRSFFLPYLRSSNVAMFDPFNYLCDASICKVVDEQHILYTDSSHISAYGGEFLAKRGKSELQTIFSTIKD